MTYRHRALAVQVDQLLGDEERRGPRLGPGLLPLGPAHARERGRVAARVRREHVDLFGRPVAAAVLEFEDEVVARRAVDGAGRRPGEPRHPVLAVHDVTADREVVEEAVDVARPRARGAVHGPSPGQVALAPHDDLGVVEAESRRERTLQDAEAHVEDLVGVGRHLETLRAQLVRHPLDRGGVGREHDAAARRSTRSARAPRSARRRPGRRGATSGSSRPPDNAPTVGSSATSTRPSRTSRHDPCSSGDRRARLPRRGDRVGQLTLFLEQVAEARAAPVRARRRRP